MASSAGRLISPCLFSRPAVLLPPLARAQSALPAVAPRGLTPADRRARALARLRQLREDAATDGAAAYLPPPYLLPGGRSPLGAAAAVTLPALLAAGLHLGHKPRRLSPYMLPYIFGERAGVHIINLEHTLAALRRAMNVAREIAARGGAILFVGQRPALHRIAVDAAKESGGYFCIDWKEGLVTNKERMLKRSTGFDPSRAVHTPHLIVFLDMPNTMPAVYEAIQCGIPTVAVVDTDMDPRKVTYPVPGNDDSAASVGYVAECLARAAREGLEVRTAGVTGKQARPVRKVERKEEGEASWGEGWDAPT
ncbi:ribosomal protein S2, flavodoxin-like domain-containing protein [Hyaloraphidium curvatum]|nr:ribosomal protein S2, flavodoxin-like domain-containing protein [Hyaloraphidium curvatum]